MIVCSLGGGAWWAGFVILWKCQSVAERDDWISDWTHREQSHIFSHYFQNRDLHHSLFKMNNFVSLKPKPAEIKVAKSALADILTLTNHHHIHFQIRVKSLAKTSCPHQPTLHFKEERRRFLKLEKCKPAPMSKIVFSDLCEQYVVMTVWMFCNCFYPI